MKNIAIFISTLGCGGAEKQAALLAQVLAKHYMVHFVVYGNSDEPSNMVMRILLDAKINVYPLTGTQKAKFKGYAKILKDNNVFCAFNYLTKCDFWGAIIEKHCGVERIYNGIRNSQLEGYKVVLEWISHNFIATGTIFNCYSGEEAFVKKGFKKNKCITIPNCFPCVAEPVFKKVSEKPHIITVGRFVHQKDYQTAIKAVAILKKSFTNFVFDICGYGVLENQIRNWVNENKVEDVTSFHIRPDNIPELLQGADVYLSTSLYEGTSNSIMEAMNWCLPVVATRVGDNYNLVKDGINGYLSEIGDAEELASKMSVLLLNREKRISMGAKSNSLLREHFSVEVFEEQYLRLLGR